MILGGTNEKYLLIATQSGKSTTRVLLLKNLRSVPNPPSLLSLASLLVRLAVLVSLSTALTPVSGYSTHGFIF